MGTLVFMCTTHILTKNSCLLCDTKKFSKKVKMIMVVDKRLHSLTRSFIFLIFRPLIMFHLLIFVILSQLPWPYLATRKHKRWLEPWHRPACWSALCMQIGLSHSWSCTSAPNEQSVVGIIFKTRTDRFIRLEQDSGQFM